MSATTQAVHPADAGAAPRRRVIARVRTVVRNHGVMGIWWKGLHVLGLYRCLLLTLTAHDADRYGEADIEVVCARLDPAELDDYLQFRPREDRAKIQRRFDNGERCFVARADGRIIACSWAATRRVHVGFVGCELELSPGAFYVYDHFVAPAYRGHQVIAALRRVRVPHLDRAGCRWTVGVTWPLNPAAMRRLAKRDTQVIGKLSVLRVGPWRRHRLRLDPALVDAADPPVRLVCA